MPTRTRLLVSLLSAAALLSAGCKSGPPTPRTHWSANHWTIDSVPMRMVKHFTGYDHERERSYIDYQWQKKKDINLTLRRHFLNNNPDSPFQADDPSRVAPRPPHSLFPDPIGYIHLEGIALGFVVLAQTGVFVPLPVDSLSATFFGGWGEFGEGFSDTFDGELEHEQEPPDLSDFEVKNR